MSGDSEITKSCRIAQCSLLRCKTNHSCQTLEARDSLTACGVVVCSGSYGKCLSLRSLLSVGREVLSLTMTDTGQLKGFCIPVCTLQLYVF